MAQIADKSGFDLSPRDIVKFKPNSGLPQVAEVPAWRLGTLAARALRDWEDRQDCRNELRGDYTERVDGESAPDHVRQRWGVNYIRHRLTTYDRHLEEVAGKIGAQDAADRIHERVLEQIAKVYPEFEDECYRQIKRRFSLRLTGTA